MLTIQILQKNIIKALILLSISVIFLKGDIVNNFFHTLLRVLYMYKDIYRGSSFLYKGVIYFSVPCFTYKHIWS